MGLITTLGNLASGGLLSGIGSLAMDIRQAITGDINPAKKAEIELKLTQLEAAASQAQNSINLAEAKSKIGFVAGARPSVMWICSLGLLYATILQPLLNWVLAMEGYNLLPPPNTAVLTSTLFALLGLGGYRTVEKIKGVQDKH